MALKQPMSLLDLASCAVGTVIGEQALLVTKKINLNTECSKGGMDLKLNIKKCAQYYDITIPRTLHNVVAYRTLMYITGKNFEVTRNDVNVFDLVLRCHVTKFSFLEWSLKMHPMLHLNMPKLKDLKFLCLDLLHMKNENLNYILKGIEGMKQLETFKSGTYNSDVIRVLCDSCPLIDLELYCPDCFDTDFLILSILKLKNLESLKIRGLNISKEKQKQLLFGLPRLKYFKDCELNLLLSDICDGNIIPLQKVSYDCSKEDHITNLIKFCPYVRDLTLNFGYKCTFDLSNLASLKYLTSLNVPCDFYEGNIPTILEARGYQITKLCVTCDNVSVKTLYMIDTLCPNLIKLSLNFLFFDNEEVKSTTNSGKVFQKLESFSNAAHIHQSNFAPCLIFFLRNCLTLKEVEFTSACSLCDADIDEILTSNPLVNLEKLFLGTHSLTTRSIYKLLNSCKKLMWLGYIIKWRFTSSEVEQLINYVQKNNLNIIFISYYPPECSYDSSVMLKKN